MFAVVMSSAVIGVDAYPVRVETDIAGGLPALNIVGLPDSAVREARDRVSAAIRNSGFVLPARRITVNLGPADVRKEGSSFDLAMAVAILVASEQTVFAIDPSTAFLGELSLDGSMRAVQGAVAIAADARSYGCKALVVPNANAKEAAVAEGIDVYGVATLSDAVRLVGSRNLSPPLRVDLRELSARRVGATPDLADVKGQDHAKRALEIAAAGGHNMLMFGPPGSGKTMLAQRLASVLPDMVLDESLETTKIHSVAGVLEADSPLITTRPFRAPHHTVSTAGLVGGGKTPGPGEVSLAHNGVLFLDELPEFRRDTLEALRQPLENGLATIARAWGSLTFPARTMFVAAMNPCPCGYLGDPVKPCRCSSEQVRKYRARISGPLLDRIDLHVEVPAVPLSDLRSEAKGEPSETVRARVQRSREVQSRRFDGTGVYSNATMAPHMVREFCRLGADAEALLAAALSRLHLSARAHDRVLKVARSIADLSESERIEAQHIAEAIQYRDLDRLAGVY
ncbi:YifB family Mg chelatase-like AAA ATPase [Candidatus Poribacteria bacterium]|nr:YifB family Mg chelatase-like AAA ATPase [Candidatus Poribacteria bacterium]